MRIPRLPAVIGLLLFGAIIPGVIPARAGSSKTQSLLRHNELISSGTSATVVATVVNNPPIAQTDNYTLHRSGFVSPLANDSDPDGDAISIPNIAHQATPHGWLSPYGPDYYFYTANYGYVGTDTFNYTVCDSLGACSTGTGNIQVVNNPPTAQTDNYTVHSGLFVYPLANDSDPDQGDGINIPNMVNQATAHGWLSPYEPNYYFYTANYGYVGADSFNYTVCDDLGACSTGTTNISVVNQAPVAEPDLYIVRGNLFVYPTANDHDPEGDGYNIPEMVNQATPHGWLQP